MSNKNKDNFFHNNLFIEAINDVHTHKNYIIRHILGCH